MSNVFKMLFVERPLVINPKLAADIGLNEAIVLQQIKYWTDRSEFKKDGHYWVFKTTEDWEREFPFWSKPTIRRVLKSLEKSELILSQKLHGHFFKEQSNQTLWYALNLDATPCDQIEHIEMTNGEIACDQNEQIEVTNLSSSKLSNRSLPCDQSDQFFRSDQNDQLSTEITTETTPEITYSSSKNSSCDEIKNRPDAAIQTPEGKYWGTAEDVKAASWMYQRVVEINPTAPKPNLTHWSNDIRLLRGAFETSHREICELFQFANKHHFWAENIQSPKSLRRQWERLHAQKNTKKSAANDLDWDDTSWGDNIDWSM
ncbi:hypothetical protein [Vibrio alginolyticus]|uniref:hypothetical protein n=1 Tax=Vibrio alginolyticus TaxID=663 RepID=UPI00211A88A7|nr:hypothetical protein [Vibrio alginolyticus]MCQ9087395.1 hypothetical protein [Vibrio alginolyticus]